MLTGICVLYPLRLCVDGGGRRMGRCWAGVVYAVKLGWADCHVRSSPPVHAGPHLPKILPSVISPLGEGPIFRYVAHFLKDFSSKRQTEPHNRLFPYFLCSMCYIRFTTFDHGFQNPIDILHNSVCNLIQAVLHISNTFTRLNALQKGPPSFGP